MGLVNVWAISDRDTTEIQKKQSADACRFSLTSPENKLQLSSLSISHHEEIITHNLRTLQQKHPLARLTHPMILEKQQIK